MRIYVLNELTPLNDQYEIEYRQETIATFQSLDRAIYFMEQEIAGNNHAIKNGGLYNGEKCLAYKAYEVVECELNQPFSISYQNYEAIRTKKEIKIKKGFGND